MFKLNGGNDVLHPAMTSGFLGTEHLPAFPRCLWPRDPSDECPCRKDKTLAGPLPAPEDGCCPLWDRLQHTPYGDTDL